MKVNYSFFYLTLISIVISSCAIKRQVVPFKTTQIDRDAIKIELQQKQVFAFKDQGVFFSNDFPSARINQLEKENDSTYSIVIKSENRPINPSPWFAFKVWGTPHKNVYINLKYPEDKHRYEPKITTNYVDWKNVANVKLSADKKQANFKVQLLTDTLIIAAQEIISAAQSYQWMDKFAAEKSLNKQIIGYSIGGKPIIALNTTKSDGKKIIVVLSRQHPPEVSGYMAMVEFVETLTGNTEEARNFLKNYELVIIPMINPDGVDEGNWRHSFAGVDLNRDWTDFKQPETRAVKEYLLNMVKQQNAKVYFALDFHSTYSDVLYTNEDRNDTNKPGLVNNWVKGLHDFEGSKKTEVKPSGNGGNVSKAWLGRVLNAEALTYEVGDNTPRPYLKQKAKKVAEVLMAELK